MSKANFDDMLRMLQQGWVPYRGAVDKAEYEGLGCKTPAKAWWMHQKQKYVCLGCSKRCSLVDPAGFELLLPVTLQAKCLAFAYLPAVSAQELLKKKLFLSAPEVEFVLNVSKRQVYDLLDEGRLDRHSDLPLRITAESVRKEAARRKEG
jgi:hypothetical protein